MCIFCKIADGSIPSDIVYENDAVICFRDIHPATPEHILIVPKKHFDDILDLSSSEEGVEAMGAVLRAVPEVVRICGLETGFRFVNNCREFGGQTVMHVHFHILGGIRFSERMV